MNARTAEVDWVQLRSSGTDLKRKLIAFGCKTNNSRYLPPFDAIHCQIFLLSGIFLDSYRL